MIKLWIIIILAIFIIADIIEELLQRAAISKLSLEMKDLTDFLNTAQFYKNSDFIESMPKSVQIRHLQDQADMLKFCFLCPLYQEKVLKDTQQ